MKKYTRRHYNKKLLALGLSAFMGIGLISTGFAAWVMSKDENVEGNGNVDVAIMKDASVSMKLWALNADGTIKQEDGENVELNKDSDGKYQLTDSFSFDAPASDNTGRMRFEGESGGEDLTVTIKGTIKQGDIEYSLDADLILPTSLQNAINANYIQISQETQDMLDNGVAIATDGSFTVVIKLEWGSFFKNMNPSVYYDTLIPESTPENPLGEAIDGDTMQDQMLEFWSVLTDKTIETVEEIGDDYEFNGKFTVKLTATAEDSVANE